MPSDRVLDSADDDVFMMRWHASAPISNHSVSGVLFAATAAALQLGGGECSGDFRCGCSYVVETAAGVVGSGAVDRRLPSTDDVLRVVLLHLELRAPGLIA